MGKKLGGDFSNRCHKQVNLSSTMGGYPTYNYATSAQWNVPPTKKKNAIANCGHTVFINEKYWMCASGHTMCTERCYDRLVFKDVLRAAGYRPTTGKRRLMRLVKAE